MTERKSGLNQRFRTLMFKAPMMITCEQFEGFILDYLEGGLTARQRFIFELHLKVCAECRAYLAEYQNAVALLQGQRVPIEMDPPEDLVTAVLAARNSDDASK